MHFYKLFSGAPDIEKADGTALGTIPARALKYCEALVAAARQGWYVYPPVTFSLMWTGSEVVFQLKGDSDWTVLDRFFLSESVSEYRRVAPPAVDDCYPSFLDVFSEGNIVQIWSGYAVRSQPNHCHHVRGPINYPATGNFQHYEAIIDSSWYLSPLLINIKIIKQDVPIYFPRHTPLIQVIPLPVKVLGTDPAEATTTSLDQLPPSFWTDWQETYRDRNSGQPGSYARKQRKINATY